MERCDLKPFVQVEPVCVVAVKTGIECNYFKTAFPGQSGNKVKQLSTVSMSAVIRQGTQVIDVKMFAVEQKLKLAESQWRQPLCLP